MCLSLYLLFSLLGEAPAVAGQVMISRYHTLGQRTNARKLAKKLARIAVVVGICAAAATSLSSMLVPFMLDAGEGMGDVLTLIHKTMPIAALQQPIVAATLIAEALVTGCRAFSWIAATTTLSGTLISASLLTCLRHGPGIPPILPWCKDGLTVMGVWWHIAFLFIIRLFAAVVRLYFVLNGPDGQPRSAPPQ